MFENLAFVILLFTLTIGPAFSFVIFVTSKGEKK
jgi:hypothetical protein